MKTLAHKDTVIADPPLARFLFSDTRMAVVWLVLRIYVGFSWLDAGLHKVLDAGAKTNYIYDGSGLLAFLLVLAWQTAGYIGLDRYLLPILGTPWKTPRVTITAGKVRLQAPQPA